MEMLSVNTEISETDEHSVDIIVIVHDKDLNSHYAEVACMN